MSSADADSKEHSNCVFTDIDLNLIQCDNNPAHFDGLLAEIASFCKRTGHHLPLLEHGVVIKGHRTIVDSPTAVPFFTGMDLAETLKVVRKMLEQRSIYSQLDAEQQNPTVHSGLSATRQ